MDKREVKLSRRDNYSNVMSLCLLALFSFLMLHTALAQNAGMDVKKLSQDTVVVGVFDYDLAVQIVEETNLQRKAKGLAPLKMTRTLTEAAMLRAAEAMPGLPHPNDNPHYRPNGESCFSVLDQDNKGTYQAENYFCGGSDAKQMVGLWMQSEGHRRNILNSKLTAIGVGAFKWYDDDGALSGMTVGMQLFTNCASTEKYHPTGTDKVQVQITSQPGELSKVLRHLK